MNMHDYSNPGTIRIILLSLLIVSNHCRLLINDLALVSEFSITLNGGHGG